MKGLVYGIVGGLFAFVMYIILYKILIVNNIEGCIWIATVTLSMVICGCAGIVLDNLKDMKK